MGRSAEARRWWEKCNGENVPMAKELGNRPLPTTEAEEREWVEAASV